MYSHFCRNLRNYFKIYANASPDEYRLKIALPLRAILDKDLYDNWKVCNKDEYEEMNNLIYEISQSIDIHGFETLSRDLYYLDFESKRSDRYAADREKISEQLKLVKLLLGYQYCGEADFLKQIRIINECGEPIPNIAVEIDRFNKTWNDYTYIPDLSGVNGIVKIGTLPWSKIVISIMSDIEVEKAIQVGYFASAENHKYLPVTCVADVNDATPIEIVLRNCFER